jgi:hypothetical protein
VQDLIIQPQDGKKGRSFRATCVAALVANGIFDEGASGNTIRPAWAMFAGSEAELRPFAANLRLGRKAEKDESRYSRRGGDSERYEFLRSVGYQMVWQREAEGSLVTLFHPELFRLDPGMVDPSGLKFLMLVPEEWASGQKLECGRAVQHVKKLAKQLKCPFSDDTLAALVPTAYLFAAFCDRRTRCPLLADGAFYLQMLIAALAAGIASQPGDRLDYPSYREEWGLNSKHYFNATGLADVGILHAFSMKTSHEAFEQFLAEQVSIFFDIQGDFTSVGQRVDLSAFQDSV